MKQLITYRTAFIAFAVAFAAAVFLNSEPPCRAGAYGDTRDFCLVTRITITNSSTSDLTDYPARVLLPIKSMVGGDQVDPRAWDSFAVLGSASNEISTTAQSMDSSAAPWWFTVPDLPAGSSRQIDLYTGSNKVRIDNAVQFTGQEEITVPHSLANDGATSLRVDFGIILHDDTARNANIVDKYDDSGNSGYRITLTSGALRIRARFSSTDVCNLTWDSSWTGVPQYFTVRYAAAVGDDVFIDRNGANEVACDTDLAGVADPAEPVVIGGETNPSTAPALSDATLLGFRIEGTSGFEYFPLHAADLTETNSTNPFTGTIEDLGTGGNDAAYTFDRDQTDLDFSVSVVSPNLFTPDLTLSEGNSVVGAPVPSGFETARPTVTSGVIYPAVIQPLQTVATATGAPAEGIIAAFFFVLSALLALVVWKLTGGFMPAAVMTLGIGPTIAVVLGYVAEWWLLIWGLTVVVVWFAQLRSQQQS